MFAHRMRAASCSGTRCSTRSSRWCRSRRCRWASCWPDRLWSQSICALHGAGYLAWESIARNDLPMVQALILVFSMGYIVFIFLANVLNAWLDPRMRSSRDDPDPNP